jgi:eukaryotic-like serine/threonine-protein kinase
MGEHKGAASRICSQGHSWEISAGLMSCPICAKSQTKAMERQELPHQPASVSERAEIDDTDMKVAAAFEGHNRYRILERIGKGGMGTVYKAEHRLFARIVAVKVISPDLMADPLAVKRFMSEMLAMGRLLHLNIVLAWEADQIDDLYFLVMEYLQGVNLSQLVKEQGPLPVAIACAYIKQVAGALGYSHAHGHIHGDIKPQNLMLERPDRIKVLDFGLTRLITNRSSNESPTREQITTRMFDQGSLATIATNDGMILGTPDFIAPEQITDSRRRDHRSDLYSLGCTFYYLLTGHVPFEAGSILEKLRAHQSETPRTIIAYRSDVPVEVITVVSRLMSKRPEDRFQTGMELVNALDGLTIPAAASAEAPGFQPLSMAQSMQSTIRRWLAPKIDKHT